ncbi:MAG: hypothetical protein PVS2B2_01230 [Candidatus Acidiferrum sp.]
MLKINKSILRPELGSKFFTQHDLRWAFQKQPQNLQRLSLQPDFTSVLAELIGPRVKLKGTKALAQGWLRSFCHEST